MILEGGISYNQNWDKNGNIYYTDENGQVVDFKVNPFVKLANKAKATATNIGDWINETNPNSEAYKQKVGTVLGLVTAPLGLGATLTGGIARGLTPHVSRKIAQNMATGASSGVAGGTVTGGLEAGLNGENIGLGALKGGALGLLGGLVGGYGLGKVADKFNKANVKPMTELTEFKKWFRDSKTVDKNGNPMIFYHGSPNKFEIFDKNRQTEGQLGKGFYFTNNRREAENYGMDNVYDVYLQMKKPFDIDADINTISKQLDIPVAELENLTHADVNNVLKQKGFDGIVAKNYWGEGSDYYTVFEPTQIKSVNNQGTFDPVNPNIYKSILAPIGAGALAERLLNKEYNERNSY